MLPSILATFAPIVFKAILPQLLSDIAKVTGKAKTDNTVIAASQTAADTVITSITQELDKNEKVAVVHTKPMVKSVEGWTAIGSAVVVLGNYFQFVPQPVEDAINTIGTTVGLPANSAPAILVCLVALAQGFIWVRRKWYTRTITPAAADLGAARGRVL